MRERMKGLPKLTFVETKLFLREPAAAFFALAVPLLLLVILGSIPGFRRPISELGGLRVIDLYLPIIIAVAMTTLGLSTLPTYRERGILRRLATTPVQPQRVLLAQMLMSLGIAIVVTAVIVAIGAAAYGTAYLATPSGSWRPSCWSPRHCAPSAWLWQRSPRAAARPPRSARGCSIR